MLLRTPALTIKVDLESGFQGAPGRRRVRADFLFEKVHYDIVITDPLAEDEYFAKSNGSYDIKDAILCVSLSEIVYEHAHKLAAAVLTEERCQAVQ